MTRSSRPALLAVVVASALSCSFRGAPDLRASTPPRELYGPGAVEWVMTRFVEYQPALGPAELRSTARSVVSESRANGLPLELVLAVIHTESGFYNFAVSPVGAVGLMQVMPATGADLAREIGVGWEGPRMLFDPELNVRLGTRYLAWLHARYGDWDRALAAYNWGPGRIDRRLARGGAMPVAYAQRVLDRAQRIAAP